MTRVYLIGDDMLLMESLQFTLEKKGFEVYCGSYQDMIAEHKDRDFEPDVTCWGNDVTDFEMENIKTCRDHSIIGGKYMMILDFMSLFKLGKGIASGVAGFVHSKEGVDDLIKCIKALESDKIYFSESLAGASNKEADRSLRKHCELTAQEQRIMELVFLDHTNLEIAEIMHISEKTVKNHRYNICKKLGLTGRNALKKFAKRFFYMDNSLDDN